MTWRLATLFVVTGCDSLFGLVRVGDNGPSICFTDEFEDGTIDPFWHLSDPANAPIAVSEVGGVIEIALPAGMNGFNGVESKPYDLTGASAEVELVQPPTNGARVEAVLALTLDSANEYSFIYSSTLLVTRVRAQSVDDSSGFGYAPAQDRYLRLRHDEVTNTVLFETSADHALWVTHRTADAIVPIGSLYARVVAGAYSGGSLQDNVARFDNFTLRSRDCGL